MGYVLWQTSPNPKWKLPMGIWEDAFFDLNNDPNHYITVEFQGNRYKYKRITMPFDTEDGQHTNPTCNTQPTKELHDYMVEKLKELYH